MRGKTCAGGSRLVDAELARAWRREGGHDLWGACDCLQQGRGRGQAVFAGCAWVSVGGRGPGWLIFALPPAEIAVHPADENGKHELYFMCDDLKAEMAALAAKGVRCSEVHNERWGSITKIGLPGGGEIGLYQPKHPVAINRA